MPTEKVNQCSRSCLPSYAPGWDFPKLKADDHLTDHFGLVTDFLSECWTKLREGTRIFALQSKAHWGGSA